MKIWRKQKVSIFIIKYWWVYLEIILKIKLFINLNCIIIWRIIINYFFQFQRIEKGIDLIYLLNKFNVENLEYFCECDKNVIFEVVYEMVYC